MNKIIGFDQEFDLILNQLINDQLSNSLLLTGNKGIGKNYFFTLLIQEYIKKKFFNGQTDHHLSLLKNYSHMLVFDNLNHFHEVSLLIYNENIVFRKIFQDITAE